MDVQRTYARHFKYADGHLFCWMFDVLRALFERKWSCKEEEDLLLIGSLVLYNVNLICFDVIDKNPLPAC